MAGKLGFVGVRNFEELEARFSSRPGKVHRLEKTLTESIFLSPMASKLLGTPLADRRSLKFKMARFWR
jgi:hypothetical protein